MRNKIIGMLGAGQLGRMSALAGANLGLHTHAYAPDDQPPAAQVTNLHTQAAYEDKAALKKFADSVDAITYEFENIPAETIEFLETLKPVYPSSKVLKIAQDRIAEKTALGSYGLPTTRWVEAKSGDDIRDALQEWGTTSCIIKTIRFGYDGKGQTKVDHPDQADADFKSLNAASVIVEEIVDFELECSVIVARDQKGVVGSYTPGVNIHTNHILHTTTVPGGLSSDVIAQAQNLARQLAEKIDLVGVLGVELFLCRDGSLIINEIAPRPHNSGHWTMDACACSQFEQHIRAVSGLPLGSFDRHHDCIMTNLLGNDINQIPELIKQPDMCAHDYGKAAPKAGRKMGHVNQLLPLAS